MLIVILFMIVVIAGIVLLCIDHRKNYESDAMLYSSYIALSVGSLILAISVMVIITVHICPERQIAENQIKKDGIIKKIEILQSDYEDISKTDVIQDIIDWNQFVAFEKYGLENPWLSWFHSKPVVDQLEYINY